MRRLIYILLFTMLLSSVSAFPNEGFVHYTNSQTNESTVRLWNGTGLQQAQTLPEISGNINWIDAAASTTRQEHLQVELHEGGILVANVFRQSPFAAKVLTTSFGSIASEYKGFAVAYDQSGRAIIVFANDTLDPVYEIWNGTNFIGGGLLVQNDSCRGIPRWVDLAANPNNNEMVFVELDTTASHCAQVWNGTEWGNTQFLVDTDLSSSVAPRIDVAYNNNSQALVVFESDSLGAPRFATWSGSWSATSSVPSATTDLIAWVRLASSDSPRIALTTYSKSNSTAQVASWNGSWTSFTEVRSSILENSARPLDLAFSGSNLFLVYQDNQSASTQYATCSNYCESNNWSSPSTLATTTNNTFLQLASSKLTNNLLLGLLTDNQETYLSHFDSSWTTYFIGNGTNRVNSEDLAVYLDVFNDTTPPNVINLIPSPGTNASSPFTVQLNATVFDDGIVDVVRAYVLTPSGTTNIFQLSNTSTDYTVTFLPTEVGRYNITFYANDSKGHVNFTETSWFNYSHGPPTVTILSPAASSSFSNGTNVTLLGNASDVSGKLIVGNNVSWDSSIDGALGNGTSISRVLSIGIHTITFSAIDDMNATANTTMLLEIFPDRDQDGLADNPDTLEGNESWVNTTGVDELDIQVNNNATIMGVGFLSLRNISFLDANTTLLEFQHNFSIEEIDLSLFSLHISSTEFILNTQENVSTVPKTVYVNDGGLTNLCLKSTPVTDGSDITSGCNGANETDFTSCIGSNVTINGITCTDLGDTIKLENITIVSIEGTIPTPVVDDRGSSNGRARNAPSSPSTTSNNPAPSSPTSAPSTSTPKTASQTVTPKAPEDEIIIPEPVLEERSEFNWWPWILAFVGLLLVAISLLMKRGTGLKEESMTDTYFRR